MTKRKRPLDGKCVHCLADNVARNWDHVFPTSWYPATTPIGIEKWKIPSCYKCNAEYGALEEDLLLRLSCSVDPTEAAASGIYQRVLRSMDASRASSSRETKIRVARRKKLLAEILHGDEIPQDGIYPGLGERWGRSKNTQVAIRISAHSIRRLTEKIVRGIFFIDGEQFIEPPYAIDFYALTDAGAVPIKEMLDRFGREYARDPGIRVVRAVTPEDGVSSIISIEIWGSVTMYAAVMSESVMSE